MEDKQYFILKNNEKQGPLTLEELKLIIDKDTKVWYAGLDKWIKASNLPELEEFFLAQPPTVKNKNKILIGVLALLVIILAAVAVRPKFLSFGSKISVPKVKDSTFNNQQLYTLYSPGVVLIQHKYIYEITAGDKKFYFNEFFYYDTACYLTGLTENRAAAENNAQPIQGTGFFVSQDGKILTNRHVAVSHPSKSDQDFIQKALLGELNSAADNEAQNQSIKASIAQYDSTLSVLMQDPVTNASEIADVKEKMIDAQNILDESGDVAGEERIATDPATLDYLKNNSISVKKITLDLRIFTPGTKNMDAEGIRCKIVSTSNDQEVDLALIQTYDQKLPATSIRLPKLSRVKNVSNDSLMPQMSERLVMIGYNQGTVLSNTSEGIKSQLTEGKISQNTDEFKLMYTIPTLAGSSGSPVLDEKGRLVSVNFAGVNQTQSFNYGIHPQKIKEFLSLNHINM